MSLLLARARGRACPAASGVSVCIAAFQARRCSSRARGRRGARLFTVVCCRQLSSLACALCLSPSQAPSGCGSGGRRAAAKKRAALVDVTNAANAGARAAASRAKVRAFKQTAARLDARTRPLRASPCRTPPANAGAAATRRGTLPSARVRTAASASPSAPLPTRVAPLSPHNRHRPRTASRTRHCRRLDHASTTPLCPTTVPVVTPDSTSYRRLTPLHLSFSRLYRTRWTCMMCRTARPSAARCSRADGRHPWTNWCAPPKLHRFWLTVCVYVV
jgi:hypothetical protein